jgi:hypothetical protein
MNEAKSGWVGWGSEGPSRELSPEDREEFIRRRDQRIAGWGELLAVVEVRVYEHGCHSQISFPSACKLGPDTDSERLAAVVQTAREDLADWR